MNKPREQFNPTQTPLLTGINLIEASAGTGKTYAIAMLVLRFVVEQDCDIKKILVVTFTKAATEELKDRIRSRLAETRLSVINEISPADDNIKSWLSNLDLEPELILQRLNNALLDIDQAGIFTIHGFCQRILAEHALESGQLFDSEVTGDISSIKQACSDDFWRKHIYQRNAWEASLLTSEYKTPDSLLASVNFIADDMTVFPELEDLELTLADLKKRINQYKPSIESTLNQLAKVLPEGKFKPLFSEAFNDLQQHLIDWMDEKTPYPADFSCLTHEPLVGALNGQKFRKSKANPEPGELQKQHYINQLDIDFTSIEALDTAIQRVSLTFRRCLLESLQTDIEQKLQQLNTLSFDHLISRLAKALQNKDNQSLSLHVQEHYGAALIDEFQDTDQNQWSIFSTLFNTPNHALYLIGDPKQAIYKFRGADINSYFAAQKKAQHQFTLTHNWRSHPQLITAVNKLFNKQNPFFSERLEFNPVKAGLNTDAGFISQVDAPLPPLILWQTEECKGGHWSSGKATTAIIHATINEIIQLLNDDFYIQKKKPDCSTTEKNKLQAKDIAILVRTNPQAKEFQSALNKAGITAIINSKESVFSSSEARDLFTLLQAIAQPSNNASLKQALTLDWFNLDGQQLFQTINNEIEMDSWASRFQMYQQIWQSKGLMAMMQKLLAIEKVQAHISHHILAERRITNLKHCIELLQQAAIDEHLGINKIQDWLKKNITQALSHSGSTDEQQLRLESDEDAVAIITMHSSKGLEYPVVFCPFLWQRGKQLAQEKKLIKCHDQGRMIADLGSEQFEHHRQLALNEELAEDLRVFYVAVTRAKFRCYINWVDVRSKEQANDSAMAYLLEFADTDFAQQQQKLKNFALTESDAFEYRLLLTDDLENSENLLIKRITHPLSYQHRQRSLYSPWQMSSYTALSSLSVEDTPELPDDKAREELAITVPDTKEKLPRGAHTGNVIHDLLEKLSFQQISEDNDINSLRDKSCLRYGLKMDQPELLNSLLQQTVNTPLSTDDNQFRLKNISSTRCLKEMPFYLSMQTFDVSAINRILKDEATFQPLSEKTLCGYLTGFIDLIFLYNDHYYVIDYKSNALENYEEKHLIQAMREHNYGLQYWIYTLVLHQYLKHRLPDYSYENHVGGVKYLFVRGMQENQAMSGVFQTKPPLKQLEQLGKLFGH